MGAVDAARATPSRWRNGVAKVGYDFASAFEYGPELILDALEQRRTSPPSKKRGAGRKRREPGRKPAPAVDRRA